jgi:hypothetical protein
MIHSLVVLIITYQRDVLMHRRREDIIIRVVEVWVVQEELAVQR